jgi:hypothetical protein
MGVSDREYLEICFKAAATIGTCSSCAMWSTDDDGDGRGCCAILVNNPAARGWRTLPRDVCIKWEPSMNTPKPVIKAVCTQPKVAYRIEVDGRPIASALAFSNGTWGLFSLNEETRLSPCHFRNPRAVAAEAKRLGMDT